MSTDDHAAGEPLQRSRSRRAHRQRPRAPRPARADRHTGDLGRNLPLAVVSGVVLAALFLGSLFLSAWVFLSFVAVVLVVALLELDRVLAERGIHPATPVALAVGLVLLFGTYASGPAAQSLGLVLLALGTLGWGLLYPPRPAEPDEDGRLHGSGQVAGNTAATCFVTLWVPFLASFLGLLLARPDGEWIVTAAVAFTVAADIGAFAVGSRYGRRKLAPTVSPGKTWEGLLGGLVVVALLAALLVARFPGFDLTLALVFGIAVALAGVLGDLAESLVKRDLGVKDLGRIVPGHGGIMDRVDAVLFALPVAHVVLLTFGV